MVVPTDLPNLGRLDDSPQGIANNRQPGSAVYRRCETCVKGPVHCECTITLCLLFLGSPAVVYIGVSKLSCISRR